jgi:hypothetical protein
MLVVSDREASLWRPRTFRDWCVLGLTVAVFLTTYVVVFVVTGSGDSVRTALRDGIVILVLTWLVTYAWERWRRRGRS